MCGIAGILRLSPAGASVSSGIRAELDFPAPFLASLDSAIKHRGPDGSGQFADSIPGVPPLRGGLPTQPVHTRGAHSESASVVDVVLLHRRLSIIDHDGGAQPMIVGDGPDDRTAVIFNGCIYNHRELRRELTALGDSFTSDHSDTEVIVRGWRRWRDDLWTRLEGMFAVALWDRRTATLRLARDQFGEKPLYYLESRDEPSRQVAFSSVPLASPSSPKPASLAAWLRFGAATSPPSNWLSLRPGELLVFGDAKPSAVGWGGSPRGPSQGSSSSRAAFRVPLAATIAFGLLNSSTRATPPPRDYPLAPEEVESLLRRAVERRLEADVPLGAFLSGGVDSSLVSLFARRALGSLDTFTVAMPDPRYDESAFAAAAAQAIGSRHHTLDCNAHPADDLVHLIRQINLPFGDSSLLPAYWVSRAARAHVKVALSGDGGDELFAGYNRYYALPWLARLRPLGPLAPALAALFPTSNPRSTSSRAARLLHAAVHHGYFDLVSIFPRATLPPELRAHAPTDDNDRASPADQPPRSIAAAIWHDLAHYLPADLLRKTDAASMSCALEVRCPFLDTDLARAALSATIESLTPRAERKGLLKAVARRHFPSFIVDRRKMGFAIPIGEWFRTDFGSMRTLLLDRFRGAEPFGPPSLGIDIDRSFTERLIREHDAAGGNSTNPWKGRDHGQRLYALLVLSIWAEHAGRVHRIEAFAAAPTSRHPEPARPSSSPDR
ncbi:MAG: hypothetical protein H7Y88_09755 [Phycisphaerales bacterium]|nr:hypothetical protein [Phycisphaerales bacterium]